MFLSHIGPPDKLRFARSPDSFFQWSTPVRFNKELARPVTWSLLDRVTNKKSHKTEITIVIFKYNSVFAKIRINFEDHNAGQGNAQARAYAEGLLYLANYLNKHEPVAIYANCLQFLGRFALNDRNEVRMCKAARLIRHKSNYPVLKQGNLTCV